MISMIVMMMLKQRFTFYAPVAGCWYSTGFGLGLVCSFSYRLVECTKFVPGVGGTKNAEE